MSQGPLSSVVSKLFGATGFSPLRIEAQANTALLVTKGATVSLLNITAAVAIKATPGRIYRIIILAVGTSGSWTLNDCATTGAAAASNELWTSAYNATGLVA